jgi:hypothetical protein
MNGGGAEHPRSEGWSFPCLFCGTQVTRVVGPFLTSKGPPLLRTFVHFWMGGRGRSNYTHGQIYGYMLAIWTKQNYIYIFFFILFFMRQSKITVHNRNFGRSKITVPNRNFGRSKITVHDRNFGRSKITFHNRTFGRFKITAHNCNFRQPNWTLVHIYRYFSSIWTIQKKKKKKKKMVQNYGPQS